MLHDFYIPALGLANRYDRMAGYFRSSSLAAASMGFSSFVNRSGRMRMIVGSDLEEDDVRAILEGDEKRLEMRLNERLESADEWPQSVKDGVGLLGWMVGRGLLEVRVAFRVHAGTGKPIAFGSSDDGYVHEKWLVMGDEWGNRLYANGSLNESRTALQANAESLDIHCDWWDERSRQRVDNAEADFQLMWEGNHPHIAVLSLPEAVRARLIDIGSSGHPPVEVDGTSASFSPPSPGELLRFAMLRDGPHLPKGRYVGVYTAPVEPWPHQAIVANRLVETWPYSYLLCDEVGLGKTIEAALAFRGLYLSGVVRRILVAAPAGLTSQWQRQLWSKTLLRFGRVTGGDRPVHEWIVPGQQEPRNVQAAGIYEPDFVVVSTGLLARAERLEVLRRVAPFDIALLDEAHNARRSKPVDGPASEAEPNRLYSAVHDVLRERSRSLWMATATPVQLHSVEAYDLIALTDRVGAFQLDPALSDLYYEILADVQNSRPVTGSDMDFVRRAVSAISEEDPSYWSALQASLGSRRNRDRIYEWLSGGRIRSGDFGLLARLLFGAAPLSRVMMRHTRELLEVYRREGKLTQGLAKRELRELPAIEMNGLEQLVYDMLEDYCRGLSAQIAKHSNRSRQSSMGFVLSSFRLRFASSLFALRETTRRRLEKVIATLEHTELSAVAVNGEDDESGEHDEERDERGVVSYLKDRSAEDLTWERDKLMELLEAIGDLNEPSSKMIRLLDALSARVDPISKRIRQTVIFTRFYDTLTDIANWLVRRRPGILLGTYSGKGCGYYNPMRACMVEVDREEVKERFLRGDIDVLVCTDAAAEGVNLQTADLLINYDLGWNPMKLEQRIGRIDRIGQRHRRIFVLNLFYLGTAEETVYGRLLNRLAMAGLVVGPQQISLLPVEEKEFTELIEGTLTEQVLYDKCVDRIKEQKRQQARLEMPPDELYELHGRLGEAIASKVPVRLEHIWETLRSSQYLRELGCRIERVERGEYLVVGSVPGIERGARLTASRELYEWGLDDAGPRLHFATYGEPVFDALLSHLGRFPLPDCMIRLSVIPQGVEGVQVVGYALNARDVEGKVSARLITSWESLHGLDIDAVSPMTGETEQMCRQQLQQCADREFELCRSSGLIVDRNRKAAEANVVLNQLLIETYLNERRGSNGQVQYWHVDGQAEQQLQSSESLLLSGVPRSKLRRIRRYLLFDPGALDVSDRIPMRVPAVHLKAALYTARRAASAMKRPKGEITLDAVLASLKQKRR